MICCCLSQDDHSTAWQDARLHACLRTCLRSCLHGLLTWQPEGDFLNPESNHAVHLPTHLPRTFYLGGHLPNSRR